MFLNILRWRQNQKLLREDFLMAIATICYQTSSHCSAIAVGRALVSINKPNRGAGVVEPISAWWETVSQWFSTKSVPETDEDLSPLPSGILNELIEQLETLPLPNPYQEKVQLATREALRAWQANPETTSNSLVVLSPPVEATAPIIKASLENYLLDCDVHVLLGGYHRSTDPLDIVEHLKRELENEEQNNPQSPEVPVTQTDIHDNIPTVIAIPSLEQCFLRCIQGWEGVDYFQTLSAQDASRFWVFGCNHWAWAFLDKVCQISAYLEQTVDLPKLTGEELELWLHPLLETSVNKPDGNGLKLAVDQTRESYWETLASLAYGNASTAAHLWLQSLCVQTEDLTHEGTLPNDTTQLQLIQTKPTIGSLKSMQTLDRYLVHSLLIHEEMTRSHLALSLGESERVVRSRAQVLQREGIILQKGQRFGIHPAYYPKLYSELSNNNFLIGKA